MSPIKYLKNKSKFNCKNLIFFISMEIHYYPILITNLKASSSANEWLRTNEHHEQNNDEQYTRGISISWYESEESWICSK